MRGPLGTVWRSDGVDPHGCPNCPRGRRSEARNEQVRRNTANHGRTWAVLRSGDRIALFPLFAFAPVFLDPERIGRVSRWEDEAPGRQPDWRAAVAKIEDFLSPVRVGLRFFDIQEELSSLIGRKVDLNTPNFPSRYFRDQVLKDAEDLCAHA